MEILQKFGTAEQKRQWLDPLLDGKIWTAFGMTEPDVASSDARNIRTRIRRDGGDYVIDGRKWFISGAAHPDARWLLVVGVTDTEGDAGRRHSVVLVPRETPGLEIVRTLPIFGRGEEGGAPVELRLTRRAGAAAKPARRGGRGLCDGARRGSASRAFITACAALAVATCCCS